MKTRRLALAAMLFLLVNAPYAEPQGNAQPGEHLGALLCETSCSAGAAPRRAARKAPMAGPRMNPPPKAAPMSP